MSFDEVDNIYRSRVTLLKILNDRGFNVESLRKFSPAEVAIDAAAHSALDFLGQSFIVEKKDNPSVKCNVYYTKMSAQKLQNFVDAFKYEFMKKKDSIEEEEDEEDEEEEEGGKKPSVNVNIELIFMMMDIVKDVHHEISLKAYVRDNIRVSFFSIQNLVFDPREHFLVPKHTIVPKEKHAEIIEKWNLSSKSQMPVIRYHVDPIVRIIGGVLEDIIEITRPSPSAGTYTYYRIVKP